MSRVDTLIAKNRRALHDYEILETYEAGIVLTGTEVCSLRENNCQLTDCFALVRNGEVWLHNLHIAPYSHGNIANPDPDRVRKLLLHRNQIRDLVRKTQEKGMALVPLKIYFDKNSRVKIELAVARGKKLYDKRAAMAERDSKREIDRAIKDKDSLGGTFRVIVRGLLPGVGGYAVPTERLTSTIGGALFSIPAIKGVEFGMGFEAARKPGSQVHDPILLDRTKAEFTRASNNAGGLEGGMTTGMPLVVTAAMKPIPTLMQPLQTVNLDTLEVAQASKERSDVCAVPACAVVAEGEVAFAIADAYMRKFGSDNMADIKAAIKAYKQRLNTVSR